MAEGARKLVEEDATGAEQRIAAAILAPEFALPTLPSSAAAVMRLANESEVDFRRVDSVVRCDPILAARVLSIANSPAFSARGGVMSLRTAMMLLGWNTLRDVLWQVIAEAHIFTRGRRKRLKRQRRHAVAVAHLTRRLSLELAIDAEQAFVCGLLHDIGEVLADQVLAGDIAEGLSPDERDALSVSLHTHVGQRVADAWAIPAPAGAVMRDHHDFDNPELHAVGAAGELMPVVVAAAERIEAALGVSGPPVPFDPEDRAAMQVFDALELDETDVLAFIVRCEDLHTQIL